MWRLCESLSLFCEKYLFCTFKSIAEILPIKTEKNLIKSEFFCGYIHFVAFWWRREWDSNPRVIAHKLISSQPRYDHFDISAYMLIPRRRINAIFFLPNGEPRYVLLRCPKFSARCSLRKISTAATPFCSLLPPPAAVANVPTSISLHIC